MSVAMHALAALQRAVGVGRGLMVGCAPESAGVGRGGGLWGRLGGRLRGWSSREAGVGGQ